MSCMVNSLKYASRCLKCDCLCACVHASAPAYVIKMDEFCYITWLNELKDTLLSRTSMHLNVN